MFQNVYPKARMLANYELISSILSCFVDGHFLVAVRSGSVSLPILCFRVSVKQGDEKCIIMSQALPSFFLQSSPIKENQCVYTFTICYYSEYCASASRCTYTHLYFCLKCTFIFHLLLLFAMCSDHTWPLSDICLSCWNHYTVFSAVLKLISSKLKYVSVVPFVVISS
jgi:hypothetical protein